jgi:hypothetical protein
MSTAAVVRVLSVSRKSTGYGWQWLRAAALAAALAAATAVPADAAAINCLSQSETSCSGSYTALEQEQSNIWKFYTDPYYTDLRYTLEISGTPLSNFKLGVSDLLLTQAEIESGQLLAEPGPQCLPTYDTSRCGLFRVREQYGKAIWLDGYRLTITWFANANPLSQPPDDGLNTILQAHEPITQFDTELADIEYDPNPTPTDPGISGRGDSFSLFGAFRKQPATVPEPNTVVLLGTALAATRYRARKRRL